MELFICESNALENYLHEINRINSLPPVDIKTVKDFFDAEAVSGFGITKPETISGYSKSNRIARINIEGYLSDDGPSLIQRYYGVKGTGYNSIISQVLEMNSDNDVDEAELHINSPGGLVGIVDNAWQIIKSSNKPIKAIATGMIASGAYYLASAAREIVSINSSNMIGSIGVIVAGYEYSEMLKNAGVRYVVIKSENAPKKGLGIDTKEGISEIQKNVNAIEAQFLSRISEGRNVDISDVKKNFAQGGVVVAYDVRNKLQDKQNYIDAVSTGMIDSVIGIQVKSKDSEEYEEKMTAEEKKELEDKMKAEFALESKNQKELYDRKHASVILRSAVYSADAKVRELATDVMIGKATVEDLDKAVADFDKNKAAMDLAGAKETTVSSQEHVPSKGDKYPGGNADGIIASEKDLEACMDFGG